MTDLVTHDDVAEALLGARWVFARTMPNNPHWWTQRKDWRSTVAFDDVVLYVRAHGYKLRFGRTDYICFDIGPHRYWTMGSPLGQTWIINRALNSPGRDRQD